MTTRSCVLHPNRDAVSVCIVGQRGAVRDFCDACIEDGCDDDNFGRCYECADGYHRLCIGVPCQCDCPPLDIRSMDVLAALGAM